MPQTSEHRHQRGKPVIGRNLILKLRLVYGFQPRHRVSARGNGPGGRQRVFVAGGIRAGLAPSKNYVVAGIDKSGRETSPERDPSDGGSGRLNRHLQKHNQAIKYP